MIPNGNFHIQKGRRTNRCSYGRSKQIIEWKFSGINTIENNLLQEYKSIQYAELLVHFKKDKAG